MVVVVGGLCVAVIKLCEALAAIDSGGSDVVFSQIGNVRHAPPFPLSLGWRGPWVPLTVPRRSQVVRTDGRGWTPPERWGRLSLPRPGLNFQEKIPVSPVAINFPPIANGTLSVVKRLSPNRRPPICKSQRRRIWNPRGEISHAKGTSPRLLQLYYRPPQAFDGQRRTGA